MRYLILYRPLFSTRIIAYSCSVGTRTYRGYNRKKETPSTSSPPAPSRRARTRPAEETHARTRAGAFRRDVAAAELTVTLTADDDGEVAPPVNRPYSARRIGWSTAMHMAAAETGRVHDV